MTTKPKDGWYYLALDRAEPVGPFVSREEAERHGISRNRRVALDRSPSVRSYDKDGHLRIARTPISKANICEYYGREIPDSELLGLDADKKYRLLRDPEELKRGANSSNGKQLLIKHVPVNSEDRQADLTVGSLGTDAEFSYPYLYNSMTVWDADAIRGIEDDSQRELSCGYRYRADMTPGEFEGTPYDGVMRDIDFNHVALVPEGRAGADVMVCDEKPKKETSMARIVLTRKAAVLGGAISAYLLPKLAQDAKVDLAPVLKGVTAKNLRMKTPGIIAEIEKATAGKLAKDASLADLDSLIDHFDKEKIEEGADTEPNSGLPLSAEEMEKRAKDAAEAELKESEEKKKAEDRKRAADKRAADRKARDEKMHNFLKDRGASDEDHRAYDEMMSQTDTAEDEEEKRAEENAEGEEKGGGEDRRAHDRRAHDSAITKTAFDAAIATAKKEARDETLRLANSIAEAREFVAPWVGKLAMDAVSPEEVYKTALEQLGEELEGIHPSAFRKLLSKFPLPGSQQARLAADSSALETRGFSTRFSELTSRIAVNG